MSDFQAAEASVLNTLSQLDAQTVSEQPVQQVEAQGAPIQLTGTDFTDFQAYFLYELNLAMGRDITKDDVRRWRDYYHLRKPDAPYDGAPTHTLPIVRGKVRGFVSHAWKSLNRDPFFVMRTYTEAAGDARNALETAMERELDKVRFRRQAYLALKEVGLIGNCFLGASAAPDPNDETQFVFPVKAYRLENFFVSPTGVEDLRNASTFVRTELTRGQVQAFVTQGVFDKKAADRLSAPDAHRPVAYEQEEDGTQGMLGLKSENTTFEIWESYYRWRGKMWHVYYSYIDNEILHLQPSPYSDAIGEMPPYWPIRMDPDLNYVYGTGLAQATEAQQDISDFAFNSHEAVQQFNISPIMFVQEDSEAYAVLAEEGPVPGGIYATAANPKDAVFPLQVQEGDGALKEIALAKQIADGATFNDLYFQGEPLNNVRSATEVAQVQNAATTLLSDFLQNIAFDLSQFAEMYWAMIYHFKIKPMGVVEVAGKESNILLGGQEIPEEEYSVLLEEFAKRMGLDPITAQQFVQQYQAQRHEYVPGAKRDDFEWVANGAELIPDKIQRAQTYERLFSFYPLFNAAQQDYRAWNLLKNYLESLDVSEWRKFLGPEPANQTLDMQSMMQIAQAIQQMRMGGGNAR